jgi:diaminopropionate ammonia-lyase
LNRYGTHRPKLVIVEPDEAAGIFASFEANERQNPRGNYETIMAGLNCGIPSSTAWEIIKNGADAALKVKDNYAKQAMRALFYPQKDDLSIVAGESGVGGLAGFMYLMTDKNNAELVESLAIDERTTVLFYNTEGATDIDSFNEITADRPDY